ncbi:DUF4180 domain-containing protein [Agaribacter marinus]|uniref:DUF4180 domain-containing protein n=1 Tax=Agaribacter marinus TaxID=1431249 RepID=A0AA37T0W8_9ALTE|nr:DUF4180 domain-containing protein [Agaribacter marinus]GLR69580.1 hypothetical protein GCM10007852_04880 [Agaribacter marinus]
MSSLQLGSNGMSLASVDEVLGIIFSGLPACIVQEEDLPDGFFNLENGIAGEVFQKFVNYKFRAGFIIPLTHSHGERVKELVRDHSNHPFVRFFGSVEDAEKWLL